MVRLKGFEPPTLWFVAKYSIQLSYRRILLLLIFPTTVIIITLFEEFVKGFLKIFSYSVLISPNLVYIDSISFSLSSVNTPFARILARTCSIRCRASSGDSSSEYTDGAFGKPASIAHSYSVSSDGFFP